MLNTLGATDYQTGSTGVNVRQIQDALNQRGYMAGHVDGIFGPLTKEAVMRFQSDQGLVIDGIVGPRTWQALMTEPAKTPPPAPGTMVAVSPLPTTLTLQPGVSAQIVSGTSPLTLVIGGLGLLTLVTLSLARPKKRSMRRRK
ncbi:MAG: peptidoglycan-binding domain-containing protein [Pyrinomonadaceae bacterium]